MPNSTTNYGLVKPIKATEYADIDVINGNMDTIDTQLKTNANAVAAAETPAGAQAKANVVQTNLTNHLSDFTLQVPYGGATTGAANTYALAAPTIAALSAGMAVSIKINIDSTGASTLNWDGKGAKGIKKANGTNVTNLKNGGIYTLRYDGTNFILQGEGGSGNATASDLLSGKTASTDAGDIVGTLVVNPTAGSQTYSTPGTYSFTVPAGVTRILCQITGAGGGGAASSGGTAASGGGGGGFTYELMSVVPNEVVPIVVGQGGQGGQTASAIGTSGTSSSVKTTTANAGNGATFSAYGNGAAAAVVTGNIILASGGGRGGNQTSTTYAGGGGAGGAITDGGNANLNSSGTAGLGRGTIPAGGIAPTGNQGTGGNGGTGAGGTGGGWNGAFTTGGNGGNGKVILTW